VARPAEAGSLAGEAGFRAPVAACAEVVVPRPPVVTGSTVVVDVEPKEGAAEFEDVAGAGSA
jgi:hypothetical protein